MVDYIKQRLALVLDLEQMGIDDKKILKAFRNVPREEFVLEEHKESAYYDGPLPIGHGQTISQPYIVALMTQMLSVKKSDVVLEVGTGSGYQAAVLSKLVKKVVSLEIVPELAEFAKRNLLKAGVKNVEVQNYDGTLLFDGKFDKIIVTAASPGVVENWTDELKCGGILVVPEGDLGYQYLKKYRKIDSKLVLEDMSDSVRFVPLLGKFGLK